MKMTKTVQRFALAMALGLLVTAAPVQGQTTETARPQSKRNMETRNAKMNAGASHSTMRVSQMIGMNIQNPKGKSVGEIKDVVIDARTGKIRYAAVTYGGFLGVGNKMFAVPFEAFTCKHDPEDSDERIVVLDVTQKSLEGATGFDEDSWPDFADRKFTKDLDSRYGVERKRRTGKRDRGVAFDINSDGVSVDVDPK